MCIFSQKMHFFKVHSSYINSQKCIQKYPIFRNEYKSRFVNAVKLVVVHY